MPPATEPVDRCPVRLPLPSYPRHNPIDLFLLQIDQRQHLRHNRFAAGGSPIGGNFHIRDTAVAASSVSVGVANKVLTSTVNPPAAHALHQLPAESAASAKRVSRWRIHRATICRRSQRISASHSSSRQTQSTAYLCSNAQTLDCRT
jgi:hypothetical protein